MRSLVRLLCPSDVVTLGMVEDVVRHVEVSAASFSPVTRRALLAAVDLIEVAGLRYGARFSRLPPHAARRLIEGLSNGSSLVRRLFRSVRDLVVVAYFDQPAVKNRLGYRPGEWTASVVATRRELWRGEIERHEELLRRRLPRPDGYR
ncbi:MAG: hypothetical protein ACR2ME_05855 [Acidimicrobiia bacterium]